MLLRLRIVCVGVLCLLVTTVGFAQTPPHNSTAAGSAQNASRNSSSASAAQSPANDPIAAGFRLLYELKFDQARAVFQTFEKAAPQDPLGPASEAASYL